MEITTLQLENIKDTYIVLSDTKLIQDRSDSYSKGKIVDFSKTKIRHLPR